MNDKTTKREPILDSLKNMISDMFKEELVQLGEMAVFPVSEISLFNISLNNQTLEVYFEDDMDMISIPIGTNKPWARENQDEILLYLSKVITECLPIVKGFIPVGTSIVHAKAMQVIEFQEKNVFFTVKDFDNRLEGNITSQEERDFLRQTLKNFGFVEFDSGNLMVHQSDIKILLNHGNYIRVHLKSDYSVTFPNTQERIASYFPNRKIPNLART